MAGWWRIGSTAGSGRCRWPTGSCWSRRTTGRTSLRQLAPLFGIRTAAVHRIIDRLGPFLALAPARRRYGPDTVLIVDGTLVPTRDHTVAASSKNYRYSVNMQVMIDAATRLVVAVGQPQPGNRNDCMAYSASRIDRAAAGATVLADGGYQGTGLLIPHRRRAGQAELAGWKERDNSDHRKVRARVEHTFAAMKTFKILRDCRRRGRGVYWATTGVALWGARTLSRSLTWAFVRWGWYWWSELPSRVRR